MLVVTAFVRVSFVIVVGVIQLNVCCMVVEVSNTRTTTTTTNATNTTIEHTNK